MACRIQIAWLLLPLSLVSCQYYGLSLPRNDPESRPGPPEATTAVVAGAKREAPDAALEPATPAQPDILVPRFREPLYTDLQAETRGNLGGDHDVDVSPDGTQLVFSSTRHTATPKIFVRDERGGIVQRSSGPQRDIQPKFSPDGKWIAYATDREGNFDIVIVPTDRMESHWQLTRSPADEIHPTWSPDGTRIAYCTRDDDGGWSLAIVDLDSFRMVRLGAGSNPEWSPDGRSLAFQRRNAGDTGTHGIWTVPVEGGAPREIFVDAQLSARQPAWSPESRRLVFATSTRIPGPPWEMTPVPDSDLWVVDLDGLHLHRLTHHADSDSAPAWGLDGRIYFTSNRGDSPRLWSLASTRPREPGRGPGGARTERGRP